METQKDRAAANSTVLGNLLKGFEPAKRKFTPPPKREAIILGVSAKPELKLKELIENTGGWIDWGERIMEKMLDIVLPSIEEIEKAAELNQDVLLAEMPAETGKTYGEKLDELKAERDGFFAGRFSYADDEGNPQTAENGIIAQYAELAEICFQARSTDEYHDFSAFLDKLCDRKVLVFEVNGFIRPFANQAFGLDKDAFKTIKAEAGKHLKTCLEEKGKELKAQLRSKNEKMEKRLQSLSETTAKKVLEGECKRKCLLCASFGRLLVCGEKDGIQVLGGFAFSGNARERLENLFELLDENHRLSMLVAWEHIKDEGGIIAPDTRFDNVFVPPQLKDKSDKDCWFDGYVTAGRMIRDAFRGISTNGKPKKEWAPVVCEQEEKQGKKPRRPNPERFGREAKPIPVKLVRKAGNVIQPQGEEIEKARKMIGEFRERASLSPREFHNQKPGFYLLECDTWTWDNTKFEPVAVLFEIREESDGKFSIKIAETLPHCQKLFKGCDDGYEAAPKWAGIPFPLKTMLLRDFGISVLQAEKDADKEDALKTFEPLEDASKLKEEKRNSATLTPEQFHDQFQEFIPGTYYLELSEWRHFESVARDIAMTLEVFESQGHFPSIRIAWHLPHLTDFLRPCSDDYGVCDKWKSELFPVLLGNILRHDWWSKIGSKQS